MSFKFKIDAVAEIHGDPTGHYRHRTILSGSLVEGTIRRGFIKLPYRDGTFFVGYMRDFFLFAQSLGEEISAGQLDHPFSVIVWRPAPQEELILRDVAVDSTEEEFKRSMLELLEHHPERIFHNRGEQAPQSDCFGCTYAIPNIPETRKNPRTFTSQR